MPMTSRAIRILGWIAILGATLAGATIATVEIRSRRTFEVPYPDLRASRDPAIIERGRKIVYGPAACAYCHVPREQWDRLDAGEELPLTGDHRFPLPFGIAYSGNLTSDVETGIGGRTDAELARAIRHGVLADGRAALPLMGYPGMSDEDIVAAISFLRTLPPIRHEAREHELDFLGKALMAFAFGPRRLKDPGSPPATSPPEAPTVERGRYLAEHVLACGECHSDRERGDGARYSGGQPMDAGLDPGHLYVPPNLTPDPKTGRIASWSEETFLTRFRGGPAYRTGIMPWGAYRRLSDADLRAVYRFLRSLPPIEHVSGPAVIDREAG
jgi:mono/diheme cytochrome c family protein